MTIEKPFLLIFCGLPASGKSELAIRVAKIFEKNFSKPSLVVSTDSFRQMMPISSEIFKPEREAFLKTLVFYTISLGLQNGYIIISDDLNYYTSMRKDLADLAKNKGAGFGIVYINTPLEVALKWNKNRSNPLPDEIIEEIYSKFEEPGKKYRWDKPILVVDPSKSNPETIANFIVSETLKAMEKWGRPIKTIKVPPPHQISVEVEKITRKALGEIIKRFRASSLVDELLDLRKTIINKALKEELPTQKAVKLFFEEAEKLMTDKAIRSHEFMQFHIGLFGHVDHGKTALAKCLTEKPSTAALDKHPEAQKRGMTIDMGFSSFKIEGGIVTIVDLPGHHSLIEHAIAGGHIIDLALLIVAANEGPMPQTLEHLKILELLNVKNLVCVITKKDLVSDEEVKRVKEKIRELLKGSRFESSEILVTSARTKEGIDDLKKFIENNLKIAIRDWVGPFRMPCDHAFHVSGIGTVVTGTITRGAIKAGDIIELQPIGKKGKIKEIQTFGETLKEAHAGDRVGIALSEIRPTDVPRGSELCQPGSIKPTMFIVIKLIVDSNFKYVLRRGTLVHCNIGLQTVTATFSPFLQDMSEDSRKLNVVLQEVKAGDECFVFLELSKPVAADVDDKVLLFKLDLPPKTSRIIGAGKIVEIPSSKPEFVKKKVKRGTIIKRYGPNMFIVQGMFRSKEAVKRFIGEELTSDSGIKGKVMSPAGDEGSFIAKFEGDVKEGESCSILLYRRLVKHGNNGSL